MLSSTQPMKEFTDPSKLQTSLIPPPPLPPPKQFRLFASCLPGLEPILYSELVDLGFSPELPESHEDDKENLRHSKVDIIGSNKGGFEFIVSSISQIYQCHLHLGTASHILLRCPSPNYQYIKENKESITKEDTTYNDDLHKAEKKGGEGEGFSYFRARKLPELRRKVSQMKCWRYIFKCKKKKGHKETRAYNVPPLSIRVSSFKSKLNHTKAIAERVEFGILDALGATSITSKQQNLNARKKKESEDFLDTNDDVKILVRIHRDQVQISVDTSSTPIHQRGYRLQPGIAPLREDIAFALLKSVNWPPPKFELSKKGKNKSVQNELDPEEGKETLEENIRSSHSILLDPFCGSGTIAIEAAAMANLPKPLPPGRLRSTPLHKTALGKESLWTGLIKQCLHESFPKIDFNVYIAASDRNKGAIQIAMSNAERAGVSHLIKFENCAVSSSQWLQDLSGDREEETSSEVMVVSNPPLGKRLSPTLQSSSIGSSNNFNKLLPLYQKFGHQLNKAGISKVALIAKDIDLVRRMGLKDKFRTKFVTQHGGLTIFALVKNSS